MEESNVPTQQMFVLPSGQIAMLVNAAQTFSSDNQHTNSSSDELEAPFELTVCQVAQSETGLLYEDEAIEDLCGEQQGELLSTVGESDELFQDGSDCQTNSSDEIKLEPDLAATEVSEVLNESISDQHDDNEIQTSASSGDDLGDVNDLIYSLMDARKLRRVYQMVSNADGSMSLVAVDQSQLSSLLQGNENGESSSRHLKFIQLETVQPAAPVVQKPLPPDCPAWAAALNDCERIGNSYRGWVETDSELDVLLTSYKQATHSYWGTRQSPSSAKPSIRLMWKSQYVPFDGIPFVNVGSRAIVMECQFGPRRKNNVRKSAIDGKGNAKLSKVFTQTCPARVYIKKVRKFLDHAVNINVEKKHLKVHMDHAFQMLKDCYTEKPGHERYYIQLPTEAAHEFHDSENPEVITAVCDLKQSNSDDLSQHRLHPDVAAKIRELVSSGETRQFVIRNLLRHYVEKVLFKGSLTVPERHDLTYYPTVHDLQNHIYQALKDIECGILPFTAKSFLVGYPQPPEPINPPWQYKFSDDTPSQRASQDGVPVNANVWMVQAMAAAEAEVDESHSDVNEDTPVAEVNKTACVEAVTLTLAPQANDGEQRTVTRVELRMSDGTTQVGNAVPSEIMRIVSGMPPMLFDQASTLSFKSEPLQDPYEPPPEEDYDNPCDPVGLSSASLISAEVSSLHSIVLDSIHDVEQPCQLDEEAVRCDSQLLSSVAPNDDSVLEQRDDDHRVGHETLTTVVSTDDHVYCPSIVYAGRQSTVTKRLPLKLIRALTEDDDDICRTKRIKIHTVKC